MSRTNNGALTSLKASNMDAIVRSIAHHGPATQAELARRLNLSRSTISNLVTEMKKANKVETVPTISSGRRALEVHLVAAKRYFLGVDLDAKHAAFALTDITGSILTEQRITPDDDEDDEAFMARFNELLVSEMRWLDISEQDVEQACVAVAAPVNPRSGQLMSEEFFHNWDSKRIIDHANQVLDCPVMFANDATMAAVGEKYYGERDSGCCFMTVYVDQGIGAGLIINGKPYSGHVGLAGEIGHNQSIGGTNMCRCGNIGCIETVCSVPALVHSAQQIMPNITDIEQVLMGAKSGDVALERLIRDAGTRLGQSLVSVINTLNPVNVFIGGSTLGVDPIFFQAVKTEVARSVYAKGYPRTRFYQSTQWKFIAAKGAAATARLKILEPEN